jgi:tRNA A37 N6-isopentenylltransferase MiaA
MMNRTFGIPDAIQTLVPGAQWVLTGEDYSGLEWLSEDIEKPTEEALLEEVARLQADYDALDYQRLRAPEYPPMADYLDGIVKGDQQQVDAYIAACLAVKEKYPKPAETE